MTFLFLLTVSRSGGMVSILPSVAVRLSADKVFTEPNPRLQSSDSIPLTLVFSSSTACLPRMIDIQSVTYHVISLHQEVEEEYQ